MAKSWKELAEELEEETRKIGAICPSEIKRFHYGLITHSEAGKFALNQYFGHWVHAYACYFILAADILPSIGRLVADPKVDLEYAKHAFCDIMQSGNMFLLWAYGGQKSYGKYVQEMIQVFDTVQTKDQFVNLLEAFQAYMARLYLWFHWYFPWGIGAALYQRVEPEDVDEMRRLIQTS